MFVQKNGKPNFGFSFFLYIFAPKILVYLENNV